MKQLIGAGLFLVLAAGSAAAQESKLYSQPELPSPKVLERLNLRMAWNINVPMDGRRDGFVSIQIHGDQVIASTRAGVVAAYDAETGRQHWKIVVGKPEDATYRPTYNSRSVLVVRGVHLFAIDRKTGRLQWQYRMPFGIASAPVADERQIYLSGINSQVAAFDLPSPGEIGLSPAEMAARDTAIRTEDTSSSGYEKERDRLSLREVHPDVMWRFDSSLHLDYTPTMTRDSLFYATPSGHLFLLGKYPLTDQAAEVYRFQLDNRLTIPPAIHDEMAYVATPDQNLYAIGIPGGKTRWRYSAGNAISRTPFTTEADVYITVERKGLVRLDRETGQATWKLPYGRTTTEAAAEVDRVIAVNNKFVYGADSSGRLRVLDRATGKQLSYYEPFRDFNYPVPNLTTDRLLLAANNGLIVCLHDREYEKPLVHRAFDYEKTTPEILVKRLKDKLARKVSTKAVDALPLAEVLEGFRQRYGIAVFLSDRAFVDAGMQSVRDKPVLQPRVENLEVGELLKNILTQVNGTYEIVGDTVHVVPTNKVAVKPMDNNPNPMMPPPANIDPVLRDTLAKKLDAPAIESNKISDWIEYYSARFMNLNFDVDKAAFKAAGVDPDDVFKRDVAHPKGKGLVFSQILHDLLAQAKADYEVRGDKIFIVPAK
jgi:outer membrane protein assembly factor BamB